MRREGMRAWGHRRQLRNLQGERGVPGDAGWRLDLRRQDRVQRPLRRRRVLCQWQTVLLPSVLQGPRRVLQRLWRPLQAMRAKVQGPNVRLERLRWLVWLMQTQKHVRRWQLRQSGHLPSALRV